MRFQASKLRSYPTYKESGVEWIGKVPVNWKVSALRHRYSQCLGKMLDSKRNTGSNQLPYLRNTDVQWDRINVDDLPTMEIPRHEYDRYTVQTGDLLVCEGGEVGRCALWSGDLAKCGFQKALHRLRPLNTRRDLSRYMYYALSVASNRQAFNDGHLSTIAHLTGEKLRTHPFPFPSFAEQAAIARFLDRTDERIQRYIRCKQKQTALLNEQRKTIIRRAVTGEINANNGKPYRSYKPSGSEWLGRIPAHWSEPTRLRYVSSLKGRLGWQGLKAGEYTNEGPYIVSSAHFRDHRIIWESCPRVTEERYQMDQHIQLAVGDILLMKDGAAMGKLALVDEMPGPACLNSHLLLLRPQGGIGAPTYCAKFMFYYMQTDCFQGYVQVNGTGATFLGISQESIGNHIVCLPPISEQASIVDYLDHEIAAIDVAISCASAQTALVEGASSPSYR